MLSLTCPRCGRALRVKDEHAGAKVGCPGCKQVIAVRQAPDRTMSSPNDRQAALEDLVSRWQQRHAESQPPTPAELCRERPDLLPELERRIAVLVQMGALADVTHATGTLNGGDAGKDSELTAFLAPAQAPDELGRLGGYRILEVLGRGGMGVVFRAEDSHLHRQLALKAMLPTLAVIKEARERFLREARTAAAVEHDNVVVIHQVGEDRGVPFLAMPLLRGESLDDRLKREGRLPIAEVLRIGQEAARGLAAAHKRGLVHRDIKPANLWLEEETGRVKVLDFGLARALNAGDQLTRQGSILGTPAYMSPEQSSGEVVDGRSDVFSLGCVLYRMVTGQLPFQGKDAVATLLSVARDNPPAPSAVNPEVPPALSGFIMKMLSKDPAIRPSSAQEVSKALEALRGETGRDSATLQMPSAIPQTDNTSATPFTASARPRRRWAWVGAVAALLIASGVVAAIVIRIKGPDGKQIAITVPDDNTVSVLKDDKVVAVVGPDAVKPAVVAAGPSPLDKLDPAQIPASERFDWQPKQLVAVLGEHRQRHWGRATGVAVSRDGKRIATTGGDGMIRFWDPATLREIYSVQARPPGNEVWGPAFSPDGKRLAFVDHPGVAFYDLSGAMPMREKTVLETGGEGCCQLAFRLDGKRLIGSDSGGTLYLWNLTNGQTKPAWKRTIYKTGYYANPTPFALSEDGRTLACFSDAKTATLLDVSAVEPREILAVPLPSAAWSLVLSPDAKRLAVGFLDRKIRFWGVGGKTPEQGDEIDFGPEPGVLCFSRDGKRLAGAYTGIRVWDFERKAWIAEMPGISGACSDLGFTPDGQTLITAWGSGAVQFWALSGEKPQERNPIDRSTYLGNGTSFVICLFSPDGRRLATQGFAGFGWWDLDRASPAKLREMVGRYPLAISPDRKQMLTGFGLRWCDVASDALKESEQYDQVKDDTRYRLLPGGNTVLVGTTNGEVLFVERGAERKLIERSRFRVGDGRVNTLEVSSDGRMAATYTESGLAVKLWDLTGDKAALRDALSEGRQIYQLQFSADGRQFAVSDTSGRISVWDVQNRPAQQRRQWQLQDGAALSVAFSPDGRTLATAGIAGKLALRDIDTGETRREWQLPGQINYVTYAPDGRHLLTINGNGTGYILRLGPSPAARVDGAWLKQVAALPAEKQVDAVAAKLKELNPGFDGKVTPTIDNGIVTGVAFRTDEVTDISSVRALTGLLFLECSAAALGGGHALSDLSPLKGLPLTYLHISGTNVSDLSPLKGTKLTTLICSYTQVSDLTPVKAMPRLEALNCNGCKVSDLSPLKGLKLTGLACATTKVSDLSPLQGMPLTGLECQDNAALSDLSSLKGMPLKTLHCDFKPERDARILRAIPTLETINGKPAKDFWKEVDGKK